MNAKTNQIFLCYLISSNYLLNFAGYSAASLFRRLDDAIIRVSWTIEPVLKGITNKGPFSRSLTERGTRFERKG